ncbi:PTS system mannose-specific IIA component [Rubricella aquisinus]|uniref:PTS system mannose-specific IIA component n=1 Tax=Rubricella aquisinus TaxID=2028108 RepID=A0A840WNT2_9RHOB|nr:PTS system mannose-specific IIA component [Rubricella aquisinus]
MIGIVIVAHDTLATAYKAAMEHVVGPLDNVRAMAIASDDSLADRQADICLAADEVDTGAGVVLVTDLFGSTPSNLALNACIVDRMDVIYGANLPLLIQLAKSRNLSRSEAVASALKTGRRYIDVWDAPVAAAE